MGKKVEAQNTWAAVVLRYSLETVDWCRSDMKELDRSTRRIMRQNRAYQYSTSMARIYQPRLEGRRGLVCLEQAWEMETVATAAYLHSSRDSKVREAMWSLEEVATLRKNGLGVRAREIEEK